MIRTRLRQGMNFGLATALFVASGAGCATKQQTGTLIGAGAGLGAGAGIGAAVGGKKGAIIGGTVGAIGGAAAGNLIGRYMDKQEEKLKQVEGAKVERAGDQLVVKFDSAILFDTGKSTLKPQSEKDLEAFSKVLTEFEETNLVIEGHTDSTGGKKVNQQLSEKRAEAVIAYLESHGVKRARMTGKGMADGEPVGDNTTNEGRQLNRRVEVEIAANEDLKKKADEEAAASETAPNTAAK
ncbi:MAG: OmpA family protein [Myxococcales bacterium]|nr:OmpA family protein [Myxococcales bacterium]